MNFSSPPLDDGGGNPLDYGVAAATDPNISLVFSPPPNLSLALPGQSTPTLLLFHSYLLFKTYVTLMFKKRTIVI